jgi:hypothetical protein
MSTRDQDRDTRAGSEDLRDSEMMAHLLDALGAGEDIGRFGRLVFVMVARHFLEEDEIVDLLKHNISEEDAQALILQVKARDYSPPKRERILEWQAQQEFPICPNPEDPNACNVYRELRFPEEIYERIDEFWQEVSEAQE